MSQQDEGEVVRDACYLAPRHVRWVSIELALDPASKWAGRACTESLRYSETVVLDGTAVAVDNASSASEDMYAVLDAGTRTAAAQDGVPESLHS